MPLCRLNQDANYKESIVRIIDFKHHGLTQLVKAASKSYVDDKNESTTGLHVAAAEGRHKTVAALLAAGAPADALNEVWLDPLSMRSICTEIYFTFMLECVCTYLAIQPLATHARG